MTPDPEQVAERNSPSRAVLPESPAAEGHRPAQAVGEAARNGYRREAGVEQKQRGGRAPGDDPDGGERNREERDEHRERCQQPAPDSARVLIDR